MTAPSPDLVVDARAGAAGVTPFSPVGGVPLAIRHVRQAARDGRRAVTIVVADEAGRAAAAAALARRPVAGVVVSVVLGAPPPGAPVIPALSVAGPGIAMAIRGPEDLAAAERALAAALKKSVALDGVIAYYLMRPLSRVATRLLLDTRVTPNQVTLGALALGLAAAVAAATGAHVVAGLLYFAGATVDCVDGELARLRLEGSRAGEWLDSVADEVSTFALLAGIGWSLGGGWAACAVFVLASGGPAVAKLYLDLHRSGLPIDTARYPWFFQRGSAPTGRLLGAASYLFKRDAYATIVSFCLVAGRPRLAFLLLAGGIELIAGLLLVHLAVTRTDGRR